MAHTSNKTNAIAKACQQMFLPCFFAAFTTAIAFISLILGDIKPVIEFGKMMAVGMVCSFFFTFTNKTLLRVKFKYVKNINKKIKKF